LDNMPRDVSVTSLDDVASADVVVVGGGIIGAACAYHLAQEQVQVVLLERDGLASGTTSACQSTVGYDLFMDEFDLQMHLAAVASYRDIELNGLETGFQQDGDILVGEPDDEERLKIRVKALKANGVACSWLDQKALRHAEPALNPEINGGVLQEDFAQISPMQTVQSLADRARQLGARILPGVPLTGIALNEGRVSAARTPRGRIATRLLIIAAGVWSPQLGRMAGLELPVQPLKGTVLVTEPHVGLLTHFVTEATYSKTVKATTYGMAARQKQASVAAVLQNLPSGQILIGSSREFAGFDRTVNPQLIARIAKRACRLVPKLERLRLIRAYAGLRPWTPDGRPIIGPTEQVPGIFLATGHAGEGNTLALLTGQLVAELVTGKTPSLDPAPFSPDRFA
jgi:glycine/D-amino acid oxidase-like deaminating enzyme